MGVGMGVGGSGPKHCSWNMGGGRCGVRVPHHPTSSLTSPTPWGIPGTEEGEIG